MRRKGMKMRRIISTAMLFFFIFVNGAWADLLSLSFTDAPVHYILGALGSSTGLNFAISKDAGAKTVSVSFNDVSIKDALDMLAIAGGVSISEVKPKYYTVTADKEQKAEAVTKAEADRTILKENVMKAFDIKYVSTEDVEKSLKNIFGTNSAFQVSRLAQDNTREHSRIIVSTGDEEVMTKVAALIKTMDVPKPMIEIEATFVETTRGKDQDFGVEWNAMTEPLKIAEQIGEGLLGDVGKFGTFARANAWQSEALLKALRTDGNGRVLANPKMRVISGQQAQFSSETQVPILSRDSDGDINTEWKNVGISLVILPSKLEDGTIRLHVQPKVSSIVGEKKLGDVVAPVISERKSETTVFLRDGEVFLIGGLMSDREIKTMSKVPVLHQIPLFGELFKSTRTQVEKSNIMIVLRPREITANTDVPESYSEAGDRLKSFVENKGQEPVRTEPETEKFDANKAFQEMVREMERKETEKKEQSQKQKMPAPATVKQEPKQEVKQEVWQEVKQEVKQPAPAAVKQEPKQEQVREQQPEPLPMKAPVKVIVKKDSDGELTTEELMEKLRRDVEKLNQKEEIKKSAEEAVKKQAEKEERARLEKEKKEQAEKAKLEAEKNQQAKAEQEKAKLEAEKKKKETEKKLEELKKEYIKQKEAEKPAPEKKEKEDSGQAQADSLPYF